MKNLDWKDIRAVNQRFIKELERLKKDGIFRSYSSLANETGIHRTIFSNIKKERKGVTIEHLLLIKNAFPVFDAHFVISGDRPEDWGKVVTYPPPSSVYAGEKGNYDTAEEIELASEEDWSYVKRTVQSNHHIKIFKVVGNSMSPTLWDTDILFCFPHVMGIDEIRDSHIYVVESRPHNGFLVKRVVDKKDGNITVYGDNKAVVKPHPLNLENEVLSLWRVRTKMTWQLGAPSNPEVSNLEERISKLESLIQ